jgi:hypothetical protein
MKLKSLILGSVAAAGLSTAGYAADLGVLTSLDVCSDLGITGLVLSSSDNCLQITGGVEYEFNWGDFTADGDGDGDADESALVVNTPIGGSTGFDDEADVPVGDDLNDWESYVSAWISFVATSSSDFGPVSATLTLKADNEENEVYGEEQFTFVDDTVEVDEAFVQIGDTTVIMAGLKGSIAERGDDEPYNFLGLFNAQAAGGVWFADGDYLGSHVIQVVSDVGNGFRVGVGLENLDSRGPDILDIPGGTDDEGTLVGVVQYSGNAISAHLTGAAIGVLDGDVSQWAAHAGATGDFDLFQVRAAVGYNGIDGRGFADGYLDIWNALVTARATFDMFTIAASGEYAYSELSNDEGYGFGASVGAAVTEGISLNLGGRYFNNDDLDAGDESDSWQVALQVVAAVSESLTATGEVGVYGGDFVEENDFIGEDNVYYGAAELAWAPGGGFESSVRGELYNTDAYKVTFRAAKEFQ